MPAVFTLIHGILLRPLPYRQADRLVLLLEAVPQLADIIGSAVFPFNAMHFLEWDQNASSLSDMTFFYSSEETLTDAGGDGPAIVGVVQV